MSSTAPSTPTRPRQDSRTRLIQPSTISTYHDDENEDLDQDVEGADLDIDNKPCQQTYSDSSASTRTRMRMDKLRKTIGLSNWDSTDYKRARVLFLAVLVGLGSGSNYAYSAYAPQLATQLVISSTVVNLVGLAGNLGMYSTGPIWGKLVDAKGQQLPLLLGSILTFTGYTLVRLFYTHFFSLRADPSSPPTSPRIALLAISMFLTGCGGTAGLTASLNAIARSFPDKTRGSAAGVVLAGFGLSAFTFSSIGHLVWKGDAGGLLGLLAVGSSTPMLIGSFFLRPVPPTDTHPTLAIYESLAQEEEEEEEEEVLFDEEEDVGSSDDISQSRGTSNSLELTRSRSPVSRGRTTREHEHESLHAHFVDLPNSSHQHQHQHQHYYVKNAQPGHSRSSSLASIPPTALSHSPLYLMTTLNFWILFTILALLCGTGLMYINNAGTVALALAREGKVIYDKEVISGWQAKQVALISIWNCSGRVLGGFYSDFAKTRFRIARVWFLPIVCVLFFISQIAALSTTRVESQWIVSCLLGLAYGSLFNVVPMLVLEWFGMKHFSQNYGWITCAPIIGGNMFNLLFGRVYDAHTVGRIGTPELLAPIVSLLRRGGGLPPSDDGQHDCLLGEDCYGTAFKFSSMATVVALVLSIWAGVRRERASRERRRAILAGRAERV